MATREEIIKIDETTEMLFKDEDAKKNWGRIVEKLSPDSYDKCIVNYARRWAKYMQTLIAEGNTVVKIAEEASFDCDFEGITGYMYNCAVNMLSDYWKYGQELRRWHNKKWGLEDCDGVVNPTVMAIYEG